MGNNLREDTMNLDLNQEPLDQPYDSVAGLDTFLNRIETVHGSIEERMRQLEAISVRASLRQRWRHAPTSVESANIAAEHATADAHVESHNIDDESVTTQERTARLGKTGEKDGIPLVAKALGMDTELKNIGNKIGNFFDCNVCLDVAKDPILTCCGHLFCWSCFYQLSYVHSNAKECPACQGEVTDTSIIPIYGHGNNHSEKSRLNDSGLKVPPRPRAQRIESIRQQVMLRGASSSLIEERIHQISNMIGAMGGQSRPLNLDVTHGRSERTNLLGRRRRTSQPLPAPEVESDQQSQSIQVSRLIFHGTISFTSLSTALNSAMNSAERLVEDLETYIQNQSTSRSRPHSLPNSINNGDPLSSIAARVGSDSMAPDPAVGITHLVPQFESSSRSVNTTNNIVDRVEIQTGIASELNRTILPSSSTNRRSDIQLRSDTDNEMLREPRRRRLG